MNQVNLIGRLGKEAEVREAQVGSDKRKVATFNLAVKRAGKKDEVDWIRCVAWTRLAEVVEKYTKTGSQVGVTGSIRVNQYTDKDLNKQTSTDILVSDIYLLDSKQETEKLPF